MRKEEGIRMARPAKAAAVSSGKISTEERQLREEIEAGLRGAQDEITPPDYLNEDQKAIFEFVATELADSEILGSLDVFALSSFATAVDRLRQIEGMVNEDPGLLSDTALMGTRAKYQSDLWRGCNELCLSPQARAKISSLAAQAAKKAAADPLLEALADDR